MHRQVHFTLTASHKDIKGRFILVNGLIDGTELCLMNVYGQNEDDPGFIRRVCSYDATV